MSESFLGLKVGWNIIFLMSEYRIGTEYWRVSFKSTGREMFNSPDQIYPSVIGFIVQQQQSEAKV